MSDICESELNNLQHVSENKLTLKNQLLNFCKEHSCQTVNLIAGQRFPEIVYDQFCGGNICSNFQLDEDNNHGIKVGYAIDRTFDISWVRGKSMPTCVQESVVGFINNHLIYLTGYCAGLHGGGHKSSKARRGFSQACYGFDLGTNSWKRLPDFPGQGRQGARGVVINDMLYVWGGWTYQPMTAAQINNIPESQWPSKKGCQTFSDGYRLSCRTEVDENAEGVRVNKEVWVWEQLPSLPFPRTNFGICSWNGQIYLCTGGQVLNGQMTSSNEYNYLYKYDHSLATWMQLSAMPGTCRINCSMACVNGAIFVLGGMAPNDKWKYSTTNVSRCYGILDQWKYLIDSDKWVATSDNVTMHGNWGGHDQIVYGGRYIIMAGGSFFPDFKRMEQIVERLIKPCTHDVSHCACGNSFLDRVYAFDTVTEKFMKCRSNLPGLVNLPMIRVVGNQVIFLGGETYSFTWQGENYPRPHIDLFAIGNLKFD